MFKDHHSRTDLGTKMVDDNKIEKNDLASDLKYYWTNPELYLSKIVEISIDMRIYADILTVC